MPDPIRHIARGFQFKVEFNIDNIVLPEFSFQEVSGLSVSIGTQEVSEGGENRFKLQFPQKPKYSNLVLKRGLFAGSKIVDWCKAAIEDFDFTRANVSIKLLNDRLDPLITWQVIDAYPVKWEVSSFSAEKNELAIESIELSYKYFSITGT